jgi:phenylalanyl-tRNA synthetase alpha chain
VRLSAQAIQVLEQLIEDEEKSIEEFEEEGFDQATVNRALLELEEEDLVETEEEEEIVQNLTTKGKKVLKEGSPEFNILQQLDSGIKPISELEGDTEVGVGKAKQRGWIDIDDGKVRKTDKGRNAGVDPLQKKLESKEYDDELEERGLVSSEPLVQKTLKSTNEGKNLDLERVEEDFNVEAEAATPRTGKKHYYKEILNYARQTWLEMGFEEMGGGYVVPSFLNFDALYTPQDHPARELHDTFFVERPVESNLSEYGKKVDYVKTTHENGWETGGIGYGGDWSREEAEKNVLRTHTTAISARRLHEIDINEEELPKKLFLVGRNFRNETVDRTHLAEFYQTDGIVVGKDLNFANLKGYISKFFEKMGYDRFRLIPSYYPYTEMSVEVQVWDEEDEAWLGMGGAGMFRPEVVKPMLGFEAKVLAWGLGIGRIAAMAAGLTDIRELYRNDIEIINDTPVWRPDWKR